MSHPFLPERSTEQLILMHRDAHFAGSFQVMLDYYKAGGKGALPEIDIPAIEALAVEELQEGVNLSLSWLSTEDLEEVKRAKEAYSGLRDLCEKSNPKNPLPTLLARLVLSEEDDPIEEIEAIVKEKNRIVPLLVELLKSEDMHNPLFPGYGLSPALAATCLGLIGDKSALIALFEAIGEGDFFEDEITLKALAALGEPAKKFLLKVLRSVPLNEDNERAAIALVAFKDDEEVAKTCLELLEKPLFRDDFVLSTYLVLGCQGLKTPQDRQKFNDLASTQLPHVKGDCQTIVRQWDENYA